MARVRTLAMLLAVSLAVVVVRQTRADGQGHFLSSQRYEDIYYLPPPDVLRLAALGHREALAGLIWLKALVYFGDELVHAGTAQHVYNYADAMLALDPWFKRVYRWVGSSAIYRPGDYTLDDVYKSIDYLERGVRRFPDDGQLAWDLGATLAYELPPMLKDPKAKAEARLRAVDHLRVAILKGTAPPWLVLSTASTLQEQGRREQLIRHLEELYAQLSDPELKANVEARLARLRSQSYVEGLRAATLAFEKARQRDFPFLDPGLYMLVGPRPPFDGEALILNGFDPAGSPLGPGEPVGTSAGPEHALESKPPAPATQDAGVDAGH